MKIQLLVIALIAGGFVAAVGTVIAQNPNQNSIPQSRGLSKAAFPFTVNVVATIEAKELDEISNKSVTLLEAKEYDKLDAFAAMLRSSKQSWATGHWKLANIYSGLTPKGTSDAAWDARLSALRNWIAARTNSITARVALAYVLVDYAWNARGSGWADTVADEGWRLFDQRLKRAMQVLDDAKGIKELCPIYWSVRMRAALGLQTSKAEFDELFRKATNATPDYHAFYLRRAIFLLPRWNGDPGEWEADLEKSADRIAGDKGDMLYAQVVWCLHQSVGSTNMFKEYNLSWPRINKGLETIERQFPDSLDAKSERAYLAVLARDRIAARKCFERLDGKVDLAIWKSEANFVRLAHWTYDQ
jgi:hypothetical protein